MNSQHQLGDDFIPASPTAALVKCDSITREHRKRKRKVKKHRSWNAQSEQPLSNIINVNTKCLPATLSAFHQSHQSLTPVPAIKICVPLVESKTVPSISTVFLPSKVVPSKSYLKVDITKVPFTEVSSTSKSVYEQATPLVAVQSENTHSRRKLSSTIGTLKNHSQPLLSIANAFSPVKVTSKAASPIAGSSKQITLSKVNISLYDEYVEDCTVNHSNIDVFADAKLLEKGKSTNFTHPVTFTNKQVPSGFVTFSKLVKTMSRKSPTFIETEAFITNSQLHRICEEADNAKNHIILNNERLQDTLTSISQDKNILHTPSKHSHITLKQSILDDFDVNSPSPKRCKPNSKPVKTPSPRIKTEIIRTYSRITKEKENIKSSRRLFEIPDSPSTVHSDLANESDFEDDDPFETYNNKQLITSSPDFDLNRSALDNIHNLSFYYSQPAAHIQENQDLVNDVFQHISKLKCSLLQSSKTYKNAVEFEGSEESFKGFGECTTLPQDFLFHDLDHDHVFRNIHEDSNNGNIEMVINADMAMDTDDEIFANFKSPQKVNAQISNQSTPGDFLQANRELFDIGSTPRADHREKKKSLKMFDEFINEFFEESPNDPPEFSKIIENNIENNKILSVVRETTPVSIRSTTKIVRGLAASREPSVTYMSNDKFAMSYPTFPKVGPSGFSAGNSTMTRTSCVAAKLASRNGIRLTKHVTLSEAKLRGASNTKFNDFPGPSQTFNNTAGIFILIILLFITSISF